MEERLGIDALDRYPASMEETEIDALLRAEMERDRAKWIVLDDDPTGTQTVHDVSVYTHWDTASLEQGLRDPGRLFYVLTNSRGMTEAETVRAHREILSAAQEASRRTGTPYRLISRSDSTLRGWYPLETQILREGIERSGGTVDGEILFPFFREGGRYTIGGVHYVREGDALVPCAQTESARDRTFGYTRSDLPGYVEEKTRGAYRAGDVTRISLEDLRAGRIDEIVRQLTAVEGFGKICVDAVADRDVKTFCVALYRALSRGKTFLYRTAASFVKAVGGVPDRPLLTREEMLSGGTGGVVAAGSHTARTTAQIEALLTLPGTVPVPFRSSAVLDGPDAFETEIRRCTAEEERILSEGGIPVCYTERTVLTVPGETPEDALVRSVAIGEGVQRLIADLRIRPAFVIAKGGITSSDVASKALSMSRATVLGQILPGIPVWRGGGRFPGMPCVIFPGNVGGPEALRDAVRILTGRP